MVICGYLPVDSGLDQDDSAGGAVRGGGGDRLVDLPVIAFAGLVDREEITRTRHRHATRTGTGRVVGERVGRGGRAKAEQSQQYGDPGRRVDAI